MNYRKLILLVLVSAIATATASAQQYFSVGPVIGFGHSAMTNGDLKDGTSNNQPKIKNMFHPSFNAGISIIYAKNQHWGFGGDILYAQEGFKKEFQKRADGLIEPWLLPQLDYDQTVTLNYIRIPLRVYYFFGKYKQKIRPKIYIGPSFGFKTGDKTNVSANDNATRDYFNTNGSPVSPYTFNNFDLGLQAGAGLNCQLAKVIWLNVDLNYYQGFLDVLKEQNSGLETGTNWNQNLRLQVGVLFGLGKIAGHKK